MVARIAVILAMVVALLSGCAATNQRVTDIQSVATTQVKTGDSKELDLLLEPVDTVGILETQALRDRRVSFREVVFPEILASGELYPGRLKWFGWCVCRGREFLAQLVLSPKTSLSGKFIGVVVIDGTEEEIAGGQLVALSTRFEFLYPLNLKETEIKVLNKDEILSVSKKRQEIILAQGIEVDQLPKADFFLEVINSWNRVETKRGWVLTPLSEEQFDYVSRINPAYTHSQKWVKSMHGSIALDPYSTAVGMLFDQVNAIGIQPEGWDFGSHSDRRVAAEINKHLLDRKQSVIIELNRRLKASGGLKP
ncbi:MAG: hypothetical protein WCK49_11070 [Myxococcaceae bacterium]